MIKNKINKLELTWIGKDDEVKLEPRILIEDHEFSLGVNRSDNMLINGDNLLALKALEEQYTEKIKLIYIDPPYNTGAAFEHYDDGLEHSIWINLMYQRLKLLKKLLSKNGIIVVQLDDNEFHYLKVVMDEIFGRNNFITSIAIRSSTPSGLKTAHKEKTIIKTKDLVLIYKGEDSITVNPIYIKKEKEFWDTHFSKYLNKQTLEVYDLIDVMVENKIVETGTKLKDVRINKKVQEFYLKNKDRIFQTAPEMPVEHKKNSIEQKDIVYKYSVNDKDYYALNGRRFVFLNNSLYTLEDGKLDIGTLLCDFWNDIDFQNTQNEGGVSFPASKKPEKLVYRFLKLFTQEGDLVLDSFLGSGTTAAVAHKMKRRWIGIELGAHAKTHCYPRLKEVINGTDLNGITELVEWQGGGGFKFYNLAPSLLTEDKYGNWVISKEYNAQMLAAAMAKQEGFKFEPDQQIYWKQGKSTEKDYIYTTTQFITVELLDNIKGEMLPEESLLIACKSFQEGCENRHTNISIKKMPQLLLGRCEFGKEDYSFSIVNLPVDDDTENEEIEKAQNTDALTKKKKSNQSSPELFD
jgi:adenine-specific DNA-methyltransferase